jgi:hypothetical protein
MKILKRILKLSGYVLLAVLACFGMAIGGAVPFTPIRKPDERVEFKTELMVEKKEEDSEFEVRKIKN